MGHIGARFKNIAFFFLLRPLLSSSSFPRMAGYTTHAHDTIIILFFGPGQDSADSEGTEGIGERREKK